jgi:hypothetical protein
MSRTLWLRFALAGEGRIRIVLDSAELHIIHDETNKQTGVTKTVVPLEDDFEVVFRKVAKVSAEIKRAASTATRTTRFLLSRKTRWPHLC